MPRCVVDVEAVLDEIAAGAVVDLGAHQICQAKLLAGQVRKRQGQPALPLVARVIGVYPALLRFHTVAYCTPS